MVPQQSKVLTRDQNLDRGSQVDDELGGDDEIESPFIPLAGANKLEHVEAESDSRNCWTHDSRRLSDV